MDTLVIVRKIREAEALADAGKHGDARRVLEPLLSDDALTDTHRKLVHKKIDLFKKQQERMTRIISRRATSVSTIDAADQSSARTAIRKAVDPKTERPTEIATEKDKTERPTDLTIEETVRGAPTEVVPRARNVDTEVPDRGHKLKMEPRTSRQSSGTWVAIDERREVTRPPDPSDSQELAPVVGSDRLDAVAEPTDDDPRKTDIFVAREDDSTVHDTVVQVASEDESAPTITRFKGDRPVVPNTGNDTPAPWHDTPVPEALTPPPSRRSPPSVRVTDSVVMEGSDTLAMPALPDKRDDSTYLMAEDYFTNRASARNRRERSNPELKALADRLPDDDLRRELALEVVKLREQLESSGKSDKKEATRAGSRKIVREDRPESGSFHIPASQVNTIVRRAAGTDQIEVHMPGRDDDASELQVLRKDSVRGEKVGGTPTDRIALAQDYIDATQIKKPGMLKPVATWLGVLVVLGVIGWAIHLGYKSITEGGGKPIVISSTMVGEYELGRKKSEYPEISSRSDVSSPSVSTSQRWLIQYDEATKKITAVAVPGPALVDTADSGFRRMLVEFKGETLKFDAPLGVDEVRKLFGGPTPEFSKQVWENSETYTLSFVSTQGESTLEFCYSTSEPDHPLWVRLVDGGAQPRGLTRDDFN